MHAAGRSLQFAGLVVTGLAFFAGVLGGNVRLELALLGVGAVIFFSGRWLERRAG
jgi:hypothetical protein